MKRKGITFEALAEKLGQTKGALSICIGKNGNPTLKKLETIAQHLDCNVADFFQDGTFGNAMNGFVEYKGNVYRIRTRENLLHLLELVEANESKDDLTKK